MSNPALKSLDDAFLNSLASAILNEAKPKTQTNPVRLSRLCEQLADEAGASLAALVPAIRCSVADIQSCRLSEFAASQYPSMFVLARQDKGHDIILVRFSAETVDWWVSSSLGGEPARMPGNLKPVSAIEARVGRVAIDILLGALVQVLSSYGIDLALHECRTSAVVEDLPNFPDDLTGYEVSMGLVPGTAKFSICFFVSEALAVEWSRATALAEHPNIVAEGQIEDKDSPEEFDSRFSNVSVSIDAVLTTELVELQELLNWTAGRVLQLQVTTESSIRFFSDDVPLFTGRLGKVDDQLCVEVQVAIKPGPSGLDEVSFGV
jgi:flagellar motor switch protein FliM